jgi:pimeloyl-ACP methyl ester carboxylesterase
MSRKSQIALVASIATAVAAGGATAAKRHVRVQREQARAEVGSLLARGRCDRLRPVTTEDGVALHVEEVGPLDAPLTVVFVHGWVCTSQAWIFQRRSLASRHVRLVFYDQRGHGSSGRPKPENTGVEILGRDLARVIEAVEPAGRVVIVGHSMGGMTLMALAEARPELFGPGGVVAGAALLSTSSGKLAMVSFGFPTALTQVTRRLLPRSYAALVRFGDRVEEHRPRGDFTWMLSKYLAFSGNVEPALVELMETMIAQAPLATSAGFGAALLGHDKLAALPVLAQTPTLIMVGASDVLVPVDHSETIAEALPSAELVVQPSCGHMIMLEAPDAVNVQLRRLMRRALAVTGDRR